MTRFYRTPRLFRSLFPNRTWGFSSSDTIYLTFDDGPHPIVTPWILDELARRDVKATFFCLGENMVAYPDLVERIKNEGHTLGYHGFTHIRTNKRTRTQLRNDLSSPLAESTSRMYRPPYGRLSWWKATALPSNWRVIMWSWLSYDFDQNLAIADLLERAKRSISPGDILVFHDNSKTVERMVLLLPPLLDSFQAKGWKIVPLV